MAHCAGYFSSAGIKDHGQGNFQQEEFIWVSSSREIKFHGSKAEAEGSHLKQQRGGRGSKQAEIV